MRGRTAKRSRTWTAGYRATGLRASSGAAGRAGVRRGGRACLTRRMNSSTSRGTRREHDDEVVVLQLADRHQLGLQAVPRILVVQHHREPVQRLELGHVLAAVAHRLEAEHQVVEMVGQAEGERLGRLEDLRHGRLDRRQLRGVVAAMSRNVEEHAEDPLLGVGVGAGRERVPGARDGGDLALALLPR